MAELDKIRTELLNRSAIILQRHARGFVARSKYQRKRQAAVTLQVPFPDAAISCACLSICLHACNCDDFALRHWLRESSESCYPCCFGLIHSGQPC